MSLNPCFNGRWSATTAVLVLMIRMVSVLIFVLMEDGLRHITNNNKNKMSLNVLILVLMEDGLRQYGSIFLKKKGTVLILVLMEDGLRLK